MLKLRGDQIATVPNYFCSCLDWIIHAVAIFRWKVTIAQITTVHNYCDEIFLTGRSLTTCDSYSCSIIYIHNWVNNEWVVKNVEQIKGFTFLMVSGIQSSILSVSSWFSDQFFDSSIVLRTSDLLAKTHLWQSNVLSPQMILKSEKDVSFKRVAFMADSNKLIISTIATQQF